EASLAGLEEQALTWFRLGECRSKLGYYAAALTAYDRAFALDGRLYQARVASAEAHAHLGDLELAEQDAMSAAELAPESPGARLPRPGRPEDGAPRPRGRARGPRHPDQARPRPRRRLDRSRQGASGAR